MKKFSSALALAAVMGLPATGMAAEVDFGAEFEVNGYMVDRDTPDNPATAADESDTAERSAFQQRTLLTANMKGDGGVSFHTGVLLTGSTWDGDAHNIANPVDSNGDGTLDSYDGQGVTNPTLSADTNDLVTLDHAYVQIPMLGGVVRTGRMKANWANCFLTCDDRRDRIQYLTRVGGTTVFGIFDKRQEGAVNRPEDDGDQWLAGFVGNYSGWTVGSLFIYYTGDDDGTDGNGAGTYALTEVYSVDPYFKGKIGPVGIEGAINYFGGGSDNAYLQDSHTSEFLRLSFDAGPVMIEGQVAGVQNGGIVDNGFDTFSSLIGNNPTHDASPTSIAGLGSAGIPGATDELEQLFYGLRVTGNVTDQWKLMGAVGGYDYENTIDATNALGLPAADFDGSGTFFDAQVHYMVTKSTTISATYGMLSGDDIQNGMFTAAAGQDNADPSAMSLNLNTRF